MVALPAQPSREPEKQPSLILSPSDLSRAPDNSLDDIDFTNSVYAGIAQLLEQLAIVERRMEAQPQTQDGQESHDISADVVDEKHRTRQRLHDIFLRDHDYANGPQMVLMPSDVYAHPLSHNKLRFRDTTLKEIARYIDTIATYEKELESHLTNRDSLDKLERQAMIASTLGHLKSHKDHLTKILTGFFDRR